MKKLMVLLLVAGVLSSIGSAAQAGQYKLSATAAALRLLTGRSTHVDITISYDGYRVDYTCLNATSSSGSISGSSNNGYIDSTHLNGTNLDPSFQGSTTGLVTITPKVTSATYRIGSSNLAATPTSVTTTTIAVVAKRSVTGKTLDLGRQMTTINLSTLGSKSVTLNSTGGDDHYTRVTVAGNLFDSTESYSTAATSSGLIASSGTFKSYSVTGEGLSGESTYSSVKVGYTASLLSNRTVTSDTVVLGGKYLSGATLHNLGAQNVNLHSVGADGSYTRITAGGNLFDSTESFTAAATGSGIIGHSGNFATYSVTGEGLAGEGSYGDVNVGYTAEVVGNATADTSGSRTLFGDALTANIEASGKLAGLSSWTTAGGKVIGSTASLQGGTRGGSEAGTVSIAWRARTANETSGSNLLLADVVNLNTGTGKISPFVLQMSYDPSLLILSGGVTEQILAAQGRIYLAWLNGSDQWVNAVNGNTGANVGSVKFQGSWLAAGSPLALGSWGVNTADHTVWTVVDHNGQFSVGAADGPARTSSAVPEPGTILAALSILGPAGMIFRRRKA